MSDFRTDSSDDLLERFLDQSFSESGVKDTDCKMLLVELLQHLSTGRVKQHSHVNASPVDVVRDAVASVYEGWLRCINLPVVAQANMGGTRNGVKDVGRFAVPVELADQFLHSDIELKIKLTAQGTRRLQLKLPSANPNEAETFSQYMVTVTWSLPDPSNRMDVLKGEPITGTACPGSWTELGIVSDYVSAEHLDLFVLPDIEERTEA